jgi:hypothetical protein
VYGMIGALPSQGLLELPGHLSLYFHPCAFGLSRSPSWRNGAGEQGPYCRCLPFTFAHSGWSVSVSEVELIM